MAFELPQLPYALDALEPHISARTLEFHYGKHHQAYVNNLNKLVVDTKLEKTDLETIVRKADGGIFNNGAQVWNHSFYFLSFSPDPEPRPGHSLGEALNKYFGSFEGFVDQFGKTAAGLFGSGWAWLVKKADGKLEIIAEPNAGNPLRDGHTPILTCDVWEHAYYLDYQNRRPDYISGFWKLIDWATISRRYEK